MAKVEPVKENGVWKCPVCGFTAMSKKVVQSHIERTHLRDVTPEPTEKPSKKAKSKSKPPEKVEIKEGWDIGGVPVKKVKLYLRTGAILTGDVVRITKYEIVLNTSNGQVVVFKHAIDYLDVLE